MSDLRLVCRAGVQAYFGSAKPCLQTCQLSRFCRESHDFLPFLTVSRQGSSILRVLGKIILKWFKLLNQNKNGKLTRNACAIKWKTNKEEHCSYFFVPSCDFRLCSINLIVFLRVCPPFWKGSRPWERGLIPRRLLGVSHVEFPSSLCKFSAGKRSQSYKHGEKRWKRMEKGFV